MRQINYLFFTLLALCLAVNVASAQKNNTNPFGRGSCTAEEMNNKLDKNRQLNEQQQALDNLDTNLARVKDAKEETARQQRLEIARNIKELNERSEALISKLSENREDGIKEAADLAGKIAKLSKQLRHNLNVGDREHKNVVATAFNENDRRAQLQQLATAINKNVKQICDANPGQIVDVRQTEILRDQLVVIEDQADNLRLLARQKR
jgi:hypothetical protein